MKRIIILSIAAISLLLSSCGEKKVSPADLRWNKVNADSLTMSFNKVLREDWMVLAVGDHEKSNAMTIGWGAAGRLWNKPVFIVYVSEDRYTKGLMDEDEYFTVSLLPEDKHDALVYLGSHSGAEEPDKIEKAGLSEEFTSLGNPVFSEAILYIECKKIYAEPFDLEKVPEEVRNDMYKRIGVHTVYVGEIVNVMRKNY